jgi:hypothetical protein
MRGLVSGWKLLQLQHADAYAALHDPRERTIQTIGFTLEVLQHRFWEIEALLALVSAHVEQTSNEPKVTYISGFCECPVHCAKEQLAKMSLNGI